MGLLFYFLLTAVAKSWPTFFRIKDLILPIHMKIEFVMNRIVYGFGNDIYLMLKIALKRS